MLYRKYGKSGITISALGFGAMRFAGSANHILLGSDETAAYRLLNAG